MEIYIITGAPDTRKSSVIRALTGVRDSKEFRISFTNVRKQVWVETTSPNEMGNTNHPMGIDPEELISYLRSKNVETVILPLRSSNTRFGLPLADVYIQHLHAGGFTIHTVVMFNTTVPLPVGIASSLITGTIGTPSNEIANSIRNIWGII